MCVIRRPSNEMGSALILHLKQLKWMDGKCGGRGAGEFCE